MLIDVSRSLPIPLTTQVAASIRTAISNGKLRPGDEVPSTRELARQAGISRGTIVTAYNQLVSEGYLVATQGAPTCVNPALTVPTSGAKETDTPESLSTSNPRRRKQIISLKPSSGHAGAIRPAAWRHAWREASADPHLVTEPTGQQFLRHEIAEHLRMGRGMKVSSGNIVITGGTREGLQLVLMALGRGKKLRVGIEDPGHPGLRNVIDMTGHVLVPCPVDEDGVSIHTLPDDLDVLLVTPSFQYPLGASMPAGRRNDLLAWATRTKTALIEDDFNAELRYRTSPVPPLGSLGGEANVITLGTFSTLLNRAVAAGYVATSGQLATEISNTRKILGMPVSAVTQLAIAHLLRNGHVRRNTKAVHNRLARRREIIASEIIPRLSQRGAVVTEMAEANGADLAVTFNTPKARDAFASELAAHGIEIGRLDTLWTGRDDGLILSFAHLTEPDFNRVLKVFDSEL